METFYLTDTGIVRDHNEDSVIIIKNSDDAILMAVADGMGGHRAGEVASSIAISCLSARFRESFFKMKKASAVEWIKDCYDEINSRIFKYTEENPESAGMGTTLVMAIITKEYILFGNTGDSSGFIMKDKKLRKVTYDHKYVNCLIERGEITKEEAINHPKRNILMHALGISDPIKVDAFDCSMDVDEILLCSDGLTTMLSEEQIEKVLLEDLTIEEKVVKLIKKANNRGGNDNISVAYLIKNKEESDSL